MLKKIVLKVHEIETSTKHKEQLTPLSQQLLECVGDKKFSEPILYIYLLWLIGALFGTTFAQGANIATPMYYLTPSQHITEVISNGGDALQDYYDQKNSVAVRRKVIKQLKEEGLSDFDISLVLYTREYQIKKLSKEL